MPSRRNALASVACLIIVVLAWAATVTAIAIRGEDTAQQKELMFIAHTFEEYQPQLKQLSALHAYEHFALKVIAEADVPVPSWKLQMLAYELAARLHDQHASIAAPTSGLGIPIWFYWASDGLVVIPLPHAPTALHLGDKVIRIGKLSVDQVQQRFSQLLPGNSFLRKAEAGSNLLQADNLRMLGVVSPDGRVEITLRGRDGRRYTADVRLEPMGIIWNAAAQRLVTSVYRRDLALGGVWPSQGQVYKWHVFPGRDAAVFWLFNFFPSDSLDGAIDRFFTAVEAAGVRNVVLDVDFNPGGTATAVNSFLPYLPQPSRKGYYTLPYFGAAQYEEIAHPASPTPFGGHVYVMMNWGTCSAAVVFADVLASNDLAVTVGQPTGGNPQPTSDGRAIRVPHSDFVVYTADATMSLPDLDQANKVALYPEVPIPVTVADIQDGVNPLTKWLDALRR